MNKHEKCSLHFLTTLCDGQMAQQEQTLHPMLCFSPKKVANSCQKNLGSKFHSGVVSG
jgi:hypothetical protein